MSQAGNLPVVEAMLRGSCVKGDVDFSHASMGLRPCRGKFYMNASQVERFMVEYGKSLDAGFVGEFALVEQHRHIGPVVVDIDLRQPDPERVYTNSDVAALVGHLLAELRRLVDADAPMRCFLLEKPSPRVNKGGGYKDGVHLVVPDAVTRPELQTALRRAMLPHMAQVFGSSRFTNAPNDIYDEAVISRNGWMLYGSKKPDEPAPWVASWVFAEGGGASPVDLRPSELATLLSIRLHYDETPLTEEGRTVLGSVLAEAARDAEEREAAEARAEADDSLASVPPPAGQLSDLVKMLSVARATDRWTWLSVGLALHHATRGAAEGLHLWKVFARSCESTAKFDADEHADKWAEMGRPSTRTRALTVRSLFAWAKADSPSEYAEWTAAFRRHTGRRRANGMPSGGSMQARIGNEPGLNKVAFIDALRSLGTGGLASLEPELTDVVVTQDGISILSNGVEEVLVRRDFRVVASDGRCLGNLFGEFDLPQSIAFMHNNLPPDGCFACKIDSDVQATMKGKPPHTDKSLVLMNMGNPDTCFAHVNVQGKNTATVDTRGKIRRLLKVLCDGRAVHAKSVFGITNNLFINVNYSAAVPPRVGGIASTRELGSADLPAPHYAEDDVHAGRMFLRELGGSVTSCGGCVYVLDNDLWSSNPTVVNKVLLARCMGFNIRRVNSDGVDVGTMSGNVPTARRVVDAALALLPDDPTFEERMWHSNIGVICYVNGIYDFRKRAFFRYAERPDVLPKLRIPRDFPVERPPAEMLAEVRERLLLSTLGSPDVVETYLQLSARATAGEYGDKQWMIMFGERNCGKGLLEDAQEGAWGPYVNTVNANAFLLQQYTSGDAAKSMSWALDCEYTRQTYTNEVKCDDASKSIKLDGNLLKSFQSGGDVLSARKNHKDERSFRVASRLIMNMNDIPEVSPLDAVSTLVLIKFPYKYVAHDEMTEDSPPFFRKRDETIKTTYIKRPDVVDAFTWLVINAYTDTQVVPCPTIKDATMSYREDVGDDLMLMVNNFKITNNKDDIVFSSDLRLFVKLHKIGSYNKAKSRLERLGAISDKNCCVGGVVGGRGFRYVKMLCEIDDPIQAV